MKKRTTTTGRIYRAGLGLLATLPIALFGCNNAPAGGGNDGSTADALSYQGTISGKAIDSQSTRGDTSETASGQTVPPEFDTSNAVARFEDLNGQPLLDENGEPFPAVPLNADGSFDAENLPVGTDFILCIDIENDGVCDIQSCINIPADGPDDPSGTLNGAEADPLTTIVLAKLRELMDQRGIRPEDLPFSPAAVVSRIVAAYTNLYDESGVDQTILLDDIQSLTPEEIAAYFDSFIPPIAQAGMQMAEGSIDTALASDVEDVAFGAAQVFLRAGFPIVDNPGGLDLTPLADLDGVEVTTMSELFKQGGGMGPGGPGGPVDGAPVDIPQDILDALPPDIVDQIPPDFNGDVSTLSPEVIDAIIAADPALADLLNGAAPLPAQEEPPVYINKQAEPNRNFTGEGEDGGPQGPIMNDHLLIEMARLQMTGATITVGELQDLLTNLDTGLGARLTYFIFDPNFFGPPLMVFETADGKGLALDQSQINDTFNREGLDNVDFDNFQDVQAQLRAKLAELLSGTVAPSFDRLFKVLASERLGSVAELSQAIREARSHLPFSRSGPSTFYVVADGDQFAPDAGTVSAITVDADVTPDGQVNSVTFNLSGDGKYYLGFTPNTDGDGQVELIVRESGVHVHGNRGPLRLSMFDENVFQSYNGAPFADLVASSGTFYPGTNVTVVRNDYEPAPPPPPPAPIEPNDGTQPPPDGNTTGTTDPNAPPPDGSTPGTTDPNAPPPDGGVDPNAPPPPDPNAPPPDGSTTDQPQPAELAVDNGPNDQIFVLATGLGENAEPVRVDYDFATSTATYNPGGRNLLMFLPDSQETGQFALFNEDTGRPASANDPTNFFTGPIDRPDNYDQFYNDAGGFDNYEDVQNVGDFVDQTFQDDGTVVLPPPDGDFTQPPPPPPPPPDGQDPVNPAEFAGTVDAAGQILVTVDGIVGADVRADDFTHVFGIDVPNPRYDADGDPFYDDVNDNGVQDEDEPTAPNRPLLFDAADWRSTDIRLYYRRADNGQAVLFDNVAFDSPTPQTLDSVELVPRNWKPRLNAFRFGRPNTTLNLITAFAPPTFFNGTNLFNEDTHVDIFGALALINLVMDQAFNVEATVDVDGLGPLPAQDMLIDAQMFIAPIGDPFVLILDGFRQRLDVQDPTAAPQ